MSRGFRRPTACAQRVLVAVVPAVVGWVRIMPGAALPPEALCPTTPPCDAMGTSMKRAPHA
ncbi:hypothetical protein ACWD33_21685 [Streptomyces xiamenensis]|uniref:hypothetical protein n=1 Tax=Streptomyces TaxID=1883 RepID=UPI0011D1E0E4|nr:MULTISPECIES: hypothetical protein [Streptomyces]